MVRIVILQFCVAFIITIIATLVRGPVAGISALSGGLCYAVPNALFALRLHMSTKIRSTQISSGKPRCPGCPRCESGSANPGTFFFGEILKIVTVIVLLMAVILLYHDLYWPAFLVGFIAVLKSYFILLFRS